jgi:hypothetical protein
MKSRLPLFIKKNQILSIGVLLFALTSISCSVAETFNNTDPTVVPKELGEVIEWRMTKDPSPERVAIELSGEWRNLDAKSTHYAVWIGHATYLINNGDVTILSDPIFSERASPVGWAGPERLIPPAIEIASSVVYQKKSNTGDRGAFVCDHLDFLQCRRNL